ncbi:hypothetical protein BKA70DRAFT_459941 [Coprinopsis sp. MPI-PUGE-AT-0042]|nr:hypothetical protein BKA70DRAFT_459941 [Coprinopsis sp. MPI-PUGE-AT-0042]
MKAFKLLKPRRLILLDTPGIDPTGKSSDHSVLSDVANWLSQNYQGKACLAGVIYLYDIAKRRRVDMHAQQYESLCGGKTLSKLVLASSRWTHLQFTGDSDEMKREREKDLLEREVNFKTMVDHFIEAGARLAVFGTGMGESGHPVDQEDGSQVQHDIDSFERDQEAILGGLIDSSEEVEEKREKEFVGLNEEIDSQVQEYADPVQRDHASVLCHLVERFLQTEASSKGGSTISILSH